MKKLFLILFILFCSLYTVNCYSQWIPLNTNTGTACVFRSVFFLNGDTGFAAGDSAYSYGILIKTTNGGTNWLRQSAGSSLNSHQSIFFLDANTGYLVDG